MFSRNTIQFILLGALWGGSFLFLRITAPVLGPFVVTATRTFLGCLILGCYLLCIKQRLNETPPWGKMITLALVSCGIPLALIAFAEQSLTASLGAILNSTTALYSLVLSIFLLQQTYSFKQYLGFIIGIIGVVVLLGWQPSAMTPTVIGGIIAMLLGTLCYALGGIFTVASFKGYPALVLAFWQQTISCLSLLPFALIYHPKHLPPTEVILALTCLGLFSTGVAFLLYFNIIKNMGISKAVTVAYIIPIFGMLWGTIFLHEHLSIVNILGTAIILIGIYLTNTKRKELTEKQLEEELI